MNHWSPFVDQEKSAQLEAPYERFALYLENRKRDSIVLQIMKQNKNIVDLNIVYRVLFAVCLIPLQCHVLCVIVYLFCWIVQILFFSPFFPFVLFYFQEFQRDEYIVWRLSLLLSKMLHIHTSYRSRLNTHTLRVRAIVAFNIQHYIQSHRRLFSFFSFHLFYFCVCRFCVLMLVFGSFHFLSFSSFSVALCCIHMCRILKMCIIF